MKKLLVFSLLILCVFSFTFISSAEENKNLMSDYRNLLWEGDTLYYNEKHTTVSFKGESGEASVSFPVGDANGMWFYADMGNYQNKGTGFISLDFYNGDELISSYTTEKNNGNGSFNRYQLGSSEEYFPVPENAEYVQVSLVYESGEQSPYFRNLSLVLSNNKAINTDTQWNVSGKLQIVQVNVTDTDHIIWIFFVILVALIMLAVRKILDRTKMKK